MDANHNTLISIKKSQIRFYSNFDLYYISDKGEALLYKQAREKLDGDMLDRNQYPQFFIRKEDEELVVKKLLSILNIKLAKMISSKGITAIKQSICQVVTEALEGHPDTGPLYLPETIEIILFGAKKNPDLLDALTLMNSHSSKIIEHSVNVLTLTFQFAFYKGYTEDKVKKLALCALLHDLGTSRIDKELIETDDILTDKQYAEYKTHTVQGYRIMELFPDFDESVALTALEHHERLDGSGYPSGIKNISPEAQIIGLIDSYEPLKYRDKKFRKALPPYDAMQIIKKDVVNGKYNKQMFVDLCSCLTK